MESEDRAGDLAGGGVGNADDTDLGDGRVQREQVLDLPRADVLALADDDVLLPAGDAEEALVVDGAEVAGAEPAAGSERVAVEPLVAVAEEAFRPARLHLAHDAGRNRRAVVVDDADLGGADRSSVAVDASGRGIVGAGRRDGRELRGAVDALGDAMEPRRRVADEGRVDVGA